MSLTQRCGGHFPAPVKLRGRQYFDENRVKVLAQTPEAVTVEVKQAIHESFEVRMNWQATDPSVQAYCTCAQGNEASHCKHLWAAMLEVDRQKLAAVLPNRGPLRLQLGNANSVPGALPPKPIPAAQQTNVAPVAGETDHSPKLAAPNKPAAKEAAAAGHRASANSTRKSRSNPRDEQQAAGGALSQGGIAKASVPSSKSSQMSPTTPVSGSPSATSSASSKTKPSAPAASAPAPSAPVPNVPVARGTAAVNHRASGANAPPAAWKVRIQHVLHGMQTERARQFEPKSIADSAALRQLYYVLDLEQSTTERRPVVAYFQRYRSGVDRPWGPYQSIAMDRESIHRWPDAQDREILELLVGDDTDVVKSSIDSEIASSRWFVSRKYGAAIPRVAYGLLLPKLCATQRLISVVSAKRPESFMNALRLVWDGDHPFETEFRMLDDYRQEIWELRSEAVRDQERVKSTYVQTIDRGELAIINDRIIRLRRNPATAWSNWLGQETLRIPFADGPLFLAELLRFPDPPPITLPIDLQWPHVDLPPRVRLKIVPDSPGRSRKVQLRVSIRFVYGAVELASNATDSAIIDASERQVLKRQLPAERTAQASLTDAEGLGQFLRELPADGPDYWCDLKHLEAVAAYAIRLGWEVVAEGKVVRQSTSSRLNVQSNMDWFDLEGGLDFDGQFVKLPTILAAIRKGETFVTLGDGSRGMLPAAWLAKFGLLAGLSVEEGEALRFLPSQALLLDSLLEENDSNQVRIDERFAGWRQKLADFRGFEPHPAPEGFGGRLRPYQEIGLGWLTGLQQLEMGGCLADDMGLGKTVQVLALLECRRRFLAQHPDQQAPSLVVAPKSLVFNWAEEARRFAPDMRVLNFTGIERESLREQLRNCDLVLTTYGTLRRDIADLKELTFDYAILDEAQAIKNAQSLSAKSCRLLRSRHRLAMTGTPIENHLGELWSLFEFINPGMLGASSAFQRFSKATRGSHADGNGREPTRGAAKETAKETAKELAGEGPQSDTARMALAQSLRPFILRRTKRQVLTELPERTEQTLFCEMEPGQQALYDQLKTHYRAELLSQVESQGMAKSKIHVLEALLRLRQTACHPALVDPKHAKVGSAKLDMLVDQLTELVAEGHKALVFSQFTSLLALVRDRLDADKIQYEYLDGATANRGDHVRRFQEDAKIPIFLISLKAGGQGLNLTAADYVFILDPWWNPAVEAQAVDRAYRMGQTRHVFAYRLICRGTIEEKILELQSQKRSLAEAILTEDNSILSDLTTQDLERLLA